MNVCVQGLWHLGPVIAACMASLGNRVSGLDLDRETVEGLRRGVAPVNEPGLEVLIRSEIATGRLQFFPETDEAVKDVEILWVAYDTPVDDDDHADVEYVIGQLEKTLPLLPKGATVLISAQMPVGSVRRLESFARSCIPEKEIGFACSPENLRLGGALEAFLHPDRIVVGVRSTRDRERLERLLRPITEQIEWMSIESAEMTKHAINAFLATSVTFANEIAVLCEAVGADAKEVERGLKTERRIGPRAYLAPGAAFAGGTLARDIAFLNDIGIEKRVVTPLLSSVTASNNEHRQWAKRKLQSLFPNLHGVSVAMWGLTYKPGTDTLRRSSAIELCNWLIAQGALVCVHDPAVTVLPTEWDDRVRRAESPLGAIKGAQALVVSTAWPDYRQVADADIEEIAPGITILDANGFLPALSKRTGVRYVRVGTPDGY